MGPGVQVVRAAFEYPWESEGPIEKGALFSLSRAAPGSRPLKFLAVPSGHNAESVNAPRPS